MFLLKAVEPAVGQRAVGEGYIGEAGGGDLEVLVVCHDEVFHDALGGTHDIDGVGGLVGAHAEEMLRGEGGEQVHEALGLDVVVFYQGLNAITVFLAAHVFVSGEIGNYVEALLLAKNAFEDRVGEVEGVAAELVRHIETVGAADVAHKFGEAVLIEVDYYHALGLEPQNGFDKAGADGAGAAYDADFPAAYLAAEGFAVGLDVGGEHAGRASGDAVGYEFI